MKPASLEPEDICKLANHLPLLGTYKQDGIGCLIIDGKAVSTSFKPIKNRWTRNWLEKHCPDGFHGELHLQKKDAKFQDVSSAIMSEWGMPHFEYIVFDYVSVEVASTYTERMRGLKAWSLHCSDQALTKVKPLLPKILKTVKEVKTFYKQALKDGYEGIVLRTKDSPYKCGTCTDKEAFMWKIKPFSDSEGEIIGFEPYEINNSPKKLDAFGRSKRQHLQACKQSIDALGKFVVLWKGKELRVGGGDMTFQNRANWWAIRKSLLGKQIKFRYQEVGTKDLPRSPQFQGFRDKDDV